MVDGRRKRWGARWWLVGLLGIWLMFAAGCSDDLYQECSTNPVDCGDSASCITSPDYECDSRVCGIYRDPGAENRGFCTKTCEGSGDCPGGECRTFVVGSDEKYCVPSNELPDDEA